MQPCSFGCLYECDMAQDEFAKRVKLADAVEFRCWIHVDLHKSPLIIRSNSPSQLR